MPKIVKNIPLMDLMSYLIESSDEPTHVGTLQILKPVSGTRRQIVQRILKAFREGEVAPPFNYYPVFPAIGLPKWASAESFDAAYHIRHAGVPQPGTQQQLIDLIMDLHAGMLDRSRPGWIAYVIEGLEHDHFAIYWKVHHAYIDGASAIMRFDASVARSANDKEIRPLWGPLFEPSATKKERTLGQLLEYARKETGVQAKAMLDIAGALSRSGRQAGKMLHRESPLPFSAPHSIFNQPVRATRHLGVGSADLGRFRAMAKAAQVSINEIALTIVGVALDRYAAQRGAAPQDPLVAACPMAVRKEGDTESSTQIAAICVKLGEQSADIRQRLQQVHNSSRDAKEEAGHMSREALMNYLILTGGAATLLSKSPVADRVPPMSNVNVSNVAGPSYRCYLGGAEMIHSYPVSTLAGGSAINITFSSFSGRMEYAVISDARAIPEAQNIANFMADALDQLEATVIAKPKSGTNKRRPGAKKTAASPKHTVRKRKQATKVTPKH